MTKEYNITLGLTPQEISSIKNGDINKFHFLPTDDTEYKQKITISIKQVDEDSTLSECMNLSVDNLAEV
jgi:Holliday junction resolvase RusA-like endonuclease